MTRVAGSSGASGSSYPPSGDLQIISGGPNNAAPLVLLTASGTWGQYQAASDTSGKTLIIHTLSAAPWLKAIEYDHSNGVATELTLSGFGTFTSAPNFHIAGYDTENGDYWICFSVNGGSGSITVDTLYPLTISAGTITLGTGVTPPAIASKAVNPNGNCVNNGKIVQTYNDTSTFQIDDARVYDISAVSWAAAAGTNKSPYAANTNAVLDSNVPDEVAFSSGSQNAKGYVSCNHASNLPLFVEFEFSAETFTDRTSAIPVQDDGNQTRMWSIGLDPSGNYGVGFFRSNSGQYINGVLFVYDTANDSPIMFMEMDQIADRHIFAGDESQGNLGWILNEISGVPTGFKSPYAKELSPSSGTVAGFEAIGSNGNADYGATDCAVLVNIDANGWQVYESVQSLWDRGGFERFMQPYADSVEIMFLGGYSTGTSPLYGLRMPPTIYYTN